MPQRSALNLVRNLVIFLFSYTPKVWVTTHTMQFCCHVERGFRNIKNASQLEQAQRENVTFQLTIFRILVQ